MNLSQVIELLAKYNILNMSNKFKEFKPCRQVISNK
jgi:hypothetical protein